MNITLHYIGELKESYFREAAAEYEKRLTAFCRLKNLEAKNDAGILDALNGRSFKIALCVEGRALTSEEFAALIARGADRGGANIDLVIGGAEGLSEEVKAACDFRLSLSKMTFPHRIARILLLEQLYRAFTINSGMKYHK